MKRTAKKPTYKIGITVNGKKYLPIGMSTRKAELEASRKRFKEKQWKYGRKKPKTTIRKCPDGYYRLYTEK